LYDETDRRCSFAKGQSEMIELVIAVVAVVMLIMMTYSLFSSALDTTANMIAERQKSDRLLFICTFLPRIYVEGINRTVGEVMSSAITSGKYMLYYGRDEAPVNITMLMEEMLDPYLEKGYWSLKLNDTMLIGSKPPSGVDMKSCRMTIPLLTSDSDVAEVYLYRW